MNTHDTQHIGQLGEELACRFLVKRGYSIVERNYRKKYGEIDIVVKKDDTITFVEVKSVSRRFDELDTFRPEENIHPQKLKRLARTVEVYTHEHQMEHDLWKFAVIAVFIDSVSKEVKIRFFEDVL